MVSRQAVTSVLAKQQTNFGENKVTNQLNWCEGSTPPVQGRIEQNETVSNH